VGYRGVPGRGPVPVTLTYGDHMFFLFSNRLGCLGSLALSAVVTVILILLLNR